MTSNYNESGGSRFEDEGKAYGWWLAPIPGLKYVVKVAKNGAKKYAPLDWAEGQDFSTLYGCAWRHMVAAHPANKGILSVNEDDGDQMHIAHAAWNLLCLLSLVAMGKADECNDVDEWRGVTASDIPEGEDFESWSPSGGQSSDDREYGTVNFFDARNGFGFIEPEGGGEEVFVHYSEIDTKGFQVLQEGDVVEYDRVETEKGPRAEDVRKIAPEEGDRHTSSKPIDSVPAEAWR